jgi:hypothetical protein
MFDTSLDMLGGLELDRLAQDDDADEASPSNVEPDLPIDTVPRDAPMDELFSDAARLEERPPGVRLLTLLETVDIQALSDYAVVEAVAGWERLAAFVTARQAEAVAELVARPCMHTPEDIVAQYASLREERVAATEVGARLGWSPGIADHVIDQALLLTGPLSPTRQALAAGALTVRHARVILDELGPHRDHPVLLAQVQQRILPTAGGLTPTRLRNKIKRLLARLAPQMVKDTVEQAGAGREVTCRPAPHGMAYLEAYLPALDATALMAALDAAATAAGTDHLDEHRTLPQLRADALASVGWTARQTRYLPGSPHGPRLTATQQGRPVTVHVTVALTTLLGLDDQMAELGGYGPIDADTARRLASQGTWRRLVTDPTSGTVLDVGRTSYRPPADLAEHVQLRDRHCVAPGCDRPATSCQLDHTVPYPAGPTAAGNLGPLCSRHHLLKHRSQWRLTQPQPGHFQWTSPTGHTYTTTPRTSARHCLPKAHHPRRRHPYRRTRHHRQTPTSRPPSKRSGNFAPVSASTGMSSRPASCKT